MIKGLKLRKNSRPVSRRIKAGIAIGVLLLLIAGGIAGWYFFAYEPAQQRDEIKRREAQQLANDISTVDKFYLSNLSGGSISKFTTLAAEISKSQRILSDFNYVNEVYTCDAKNCSFSYQLKKGSVFTLAQKIFFDEVYTANFSDTSIDFTGIKSGLDDNPILSAYKSKKDIYPPSCGDVLNYLYSYNSVSDPREIVKIVSPPGSAVQAIENKIAAKGRGKNYGINVLSWEMEIPKQSKNYMALLYTASLLERQAFRDAFIIQKIDSVKDNKITGVMVCKTGN